MEKKTCMGTIVLIILIVIAYCCFTIIFPAGNNEEFHGVSISINTNNFEVLENTDTSLELQDSSEDIIYQYDYYNNINEARNFSSANDGVIYQADDGGYVVGSSYVAGNNSVAKSSQLVKEATKGIIVS